MEKPGIVSVAPTGNLPTDPNLPVGLALRRFRRTMGMKQAHAAELFKVSQGVLSRWETGTHEPGLRTRERILSVIAARVCNDQDSALRRLIRHCTLPVHLVCDATHRLLAASPARHAQWRIDGSELIGQSLWRYASPEIVAAEDSLADRGWYELPCQRLRFSTGANANPEVPVAPGLMEWETVALADGRIGRLTTTLA